MTGSTRGISPDMLRPETFDLSIDLPNNNYVHLSNVRESFQGVGRAVLLKYEESSSSICIRQDSVGPWQSVNNEV